MKLCVCIVFYKLPWNSFSILLWILSLWARRYIIIGRFNYGPCFTILCSHNSFLSTKQRYMLLLYIFCFFSQTGLNLCSRETPLWLVENKVKDKSWWPARVLRRLLKFKQLAMHLIHYTMLIHKQRGDYTALYCEHCWYLHNDLAYFSLYRVQTDVSCEQKVQFSFCFLI